MADLSAWTHYKSITIQDAFVDANLTDFPVLVKITSDSDVGGKALSNGYDIRFTESDGTTLLSYERLTFSITSGQATGIWYVKVPSILATGGATIRMYYGNASAPDGENATAAWDSNYLGVYHTDETSGNLLDSTSNGRNLTVNGDLPDQRTGKIWKAQHLDGTGDYAINTGYPSNPDPLSMECWFNIDDDAQRSMLSNSANQATPNVRVTMAVDDLGGPDNAGIWDSTNGWLYTSVDPVVGTWYHFACTMATGANSQKLYWNGALQNSRSISALPSGRTSLFVGCEDLSFSEMWLGYIEEIRVSSVERAAAWYKFQYRNVVETDNELTIGSQTANPLYYVYSSACGERAIGGNGLKLPPIREGDWRSVIQAINMLRDRNTWENLIARHQLKLTMKNVTLIESVDSASYTLKHDDSMIVAYIDTTGLMSTPTIYLPAASTKKSLQYTLTGDKDNGTVVTVLADGSDLIYHYSNGFGQSGIDIGARQTVTLISDGVDSWYNSSVGDF